MRALCVWPCTKSASLHTLSIISAKSHTLHHISPKSVSLSEQHKRTCGVFDPTTPIARLDDDDDDDDDDDVDDGDCDDDDDIYIMMKCMSVCLSRFCLFCLPPAKLMIYI